MDAKLEKYLDTVDKHLKPLPVSERVDIVKEVKASMQEMQPRDFRANRSSPGSATRRISPAPISVICWQNRTVSAGRACSLSAHFTASSDFPE